MSTVCSCCFFCFRLGQYVLQRVRLWLFLLFCCIVKLSRHKNNNILSPDNWRPLNSNSSIGMPAKFTSKFVEKSQRWCQWTRQRCYSRLLMGGMCDWSVIIGQKRKQKSWNKRYIFEMKIFCYIRVRVQHTLLHGLLHVLGSNWNLASVRFFIWNRILCAFKKKTYIP